MAQRGRHLHTFIDRGEAYCHGAGMTLGVPVLTHDIQAINRLGGQGILYTEPLLRFHDLLGFGVQTRALSHDDCNHARDILRQNNEWIMQCFKGVPYSSALPFFFLRLVDGSYPIIGETFSSKPLDKRLSISHI